MVDWVQFDDLVCEPKQESKTAPFKVSCLRAHSACLKETRRQPE